MRKPAAVVFLLLLAAVPFAAAVVPGGQNAGPVSTGADINVTSVNLANETNLTPYQATAVPVRVEVTVSDTAIPAPKGEMQAGPRAIGIAADPVMLAIAAVVILAAVAGIWYLARRKPADEEGKDTGNGP